TRKASSPRSARSGSPRTSPPTPADNDQRSTGARPATPATACRCGSASGSRNPSDGSRLSPADDNSATEAENATEPGSRSPPPSTTSSASPPSTPNPTDPQPPAASRHRRQPPSPSEDDDGNRRARRPAAATDHHRPSLAPC